MTSAASNSLGFRAAALFVSGTALVVLPLVLGLGAAAAVTGAVAGAIAVALGGSGAEAGRGGPSLRAQAAYDRGLALGLAAAALAFATSGALGPAALFAVAAIVAAIVHWRTRYSAAPSG